MPPPTALKRRKPWRPVQLSASCGAAAGSERAEGVRQGRRRAGEVGRSIKEGGAFPTSVVLGARGVWGAHLADAVEDEVDDLLADGVVAAGVVVGGVLLAGDQLLRVVELAVGAGADLVDDGGLEVDEDAARHVLAGAGLGEEGVEGVVAAADGLVRGHLAIGLDAVLEAVQLPAGVTGLDAGLAKVDGDDLTHD